MEFRTDTEKLLSVGRQVLLNTSPNQSDAARYRSVIRGWQRGEYVLLETPVHNDIALSLQRDHLCAVRFIEDGQACGFDTRVLEPGRRKGHNFRVSWPDKVEVTGLREKARIDLRAVCTVGKEGGPRHEGTLVDISAGGCGIFTEVEHAQETQVTVDLTLPNGVHLEQLPCVVTNVRQLGKVVFLGCRFLKNTSTAESDINFFVANALELRRRQTAPEGRLLLIDSDPVRANQLASFVEGQQYEVTVVAGVVDAFYRMRIALPTAVLISRQQSDMEPLETCRVLRRTRGCENLPIFIYGSPDAEYAKKVPEVQHCKYLDTMDRPMQIVDTVLDYFAE